MFSPVPWVESRGGKGYTEGDFDVHKEKNDNSGAGNTNQWHGKKKPRKKSDKKNDKAVLEEQLPSENQTVEEELSWDKIPNCRDFYKVIDLYVPEKTVPFTCRRCQSSSKNKKELVGYSHLPRRRLRASLSSVKPKETSRSLSGLRISAPTTNQSLQQSIELTPSSKNNVGLYSHPPSRPSILGSHIVYGLPLNCYNGNKQHRYHSDKSGTALPPLYKTERVAIRSAISLHTPLNVTTAIALHAPTLNVTKCPRIANSRFVNHQFMERAPAVATVPNKPKNTTDYPDPLLEGSSNYQKRISEMLALVSETLRTEKEGRCKSRGRNCTSLMTTNISL